MHRCIQLYIICTSSKRQNVVEGKCLSMLPEYCWFCCFVFLKKMILPSYFFTDFERFLKIWRFYIPFYRYPFYVGHPTLYVSSTARLSVPCAPCLRNRISCDHYFWYTCVKWWYFHAFFLFFNFDFLGC